MRALLIIPLFTVGALAIAAIILAASGVHVNKLDPLAAAIVGAVAGVLGVAPILWLRPRDQTSAVPPALIGTVLHMASAMAMGIALLASGAVGDRARLGYWLLGGYWVSLIVTVVQLRRLVLAAPIAKAEK